MNIEKFTEHAAEYLSDTLKKYPASAIRQMDALQYVHGHMRSLPELALCRALDKAIERGIDFDDPHPVSHHLEAAVKAIAEYRTAAQQAG